MGAPKARAGRGRPGRSRGGGRATGGVRGYGRRGQKQSTKHLKVSLKNLMCVGGPGARGRRRGRPGGGGGSRGSCPRFGRRWRLPRLLPARDSGGGGGGSPGPRLSLAGHGRHRAPTVCKLRQEHGLAARAPSPGPGPHDCLARPRLLLWRLRLRRQRQRGRTRPSFPAAAAPAALRGRGGFSDSPLRSDCPSPRPDRLPLKNRLRGDVTVAPPPTTGLLPLPLLRPSLLPSPSLRLPPPALLPRRRRGSSGKQDGCYLRHRQHLLLRPNHPCAQVHLGLPLPRWPLLTCSSRC